jgi:hypothetical protein
MARATTGVRADNRLTIAIHMEFADPAKEDVRKTLMRPSPLRTSNRPQAI